MHGKARLKLPRARWHVGMLVAAGVTAIAGCGEPHRSTDAEVAESGTPADAVAAFPAGLESLTSVRLEVTANLHRLGKPDADSELVLEESLAAFARAFLAEHLPHVDLNGSPDAWVLEVESGMQAERLPSGSSAVPRRWFVCRVRVLKAAVVDGRRALAIAYEGPPQDPPGFQGWARTREQTWEDALERFVEEWFDANPGFARESAPARGGDTQSAAIPRPRRRAALANNAVFRRDRVVGVLQGARSGFSEKPGRTEA